MKIRSALLVSSALASFCGVTLPAAASAQQAAADNESEDGTIFVTARKRREAIQDVPIAISAISADDIDRKGINTATDIANQTPGLTFDVGLVPSDTRISIRGLQATRGRPNVAVLVDGIDTSSENFGVAGGGAIANLRLVDVERIEVVKGPQTVLYGRSAFAGAINYISKRPGDKLEATASGSAGSFGTYEFKGAVGGPLGSGGLAARANFGYFDARGDYVNPNTGGRLNASKVYGGALSLQYKNDGPFSALLRGQYSKERYSERASVLLRSVDPTTGAVRTQDGGALLQSLKPSTGAPAPKVYSLTGDISQSDTWINQRIDLSGDPNNGGAPYPGTATKTWRGTLDMEYDAGDWKITSLTGITDNKSSFNEDFDHSNYSLLTNVGIPGYAAGGNFSTLAVFRNQFGWPLPFLPAYGLSAEFDTKTNVKQFSQELRFAYEKGNTRLLLDGLVWHEKSVYSDSSVFWLRNGGNPTLASFISASQGGRFIPGNPPSFYHLLAPTFTAANPQISQRITRATNSYSFAISLEQKLTSQLTAALSGRIIYDKIRYTGFAFDPTPVNTYGVRNANNQPTLLTSNAVSSSKFNPRVSLSYNNDNGLLLFGTWARGSKPGGVDTTDQNGNVTDGVFQPERVDSFELGGKFSGLNRRLLLNASLFYSIYKDQQIGTIDSSGPVAISSTENIGQSKSRGFEVEANFRPIDSISLRAAYTYTLSKYTVYKARRCSNVDSAETQTADCNFAGHYLPQTPKGQLNVSARFEQPIGGDAKLWIEGDTRFVTRRFLSQSNLTWFPSYTQTDLRMGVDVGAFNIEAWVNNVFKNNDPRTGSSTVDYGYFDLNSFNLPRAAIVALAPRRSFGVKVGAKF